MIVTQLLLSHNLDQIDDKVAVYYSAVYLWITVSWTISEFVGYSHNFHVM